MNGFVFFVWNYIFPFLLTSIFTSSATWGINACDKFVSVSKEFRNRSMSTVAKYCDRSNCGYQSVFSPY